MAEDPDRKGKAEHEGVYDAPFEVVIERVDSDQTVRCTEYDGDEEDSPMHPDTTVYGEPYGIATRAPKGVEYLAVESKSGRDWLFVADVDRPSVSAEGSTILFEMYESGGSWVVGSTITMAEDVTINARGKVVTTDPTYLGSASATEAMLLGTQVNSDLGTFMAAWYAAIVAITPPNPVPTDPLVAAYVAAIKTPLGNLIAAMTAWESTKHKVDS